MVSRGGKEEKGAPIVLSCTLYIGGPAAPYSLNADGAGASASDFGRTRQASDAVSVTSFGGTLTTSVANEGDIQNLRDVLVSLEKASALIQDYIRQEERLKRK